MYNYKKNPISCIKFTTYVQYVSSDFDHEQPNVDKVIDAIEGDEFVKPDEDQHVEETPNITPFGLNFMFSDEATDEAYSSVDFSQLYGTFDDVGCQRTLLVSGKPGLVRSTNAFHASHVYQLKFCVVLEHNDKSNVFNSNSDLQKNYFQRLKPGMSVGYR